VLTLTEVTALADAVPERYRVLVLVTTFGCLRWVRSRVSNARTLTSVKAPSASGKQSLSNGGVGPVVGPPKSRAGRRVVSLPAPVVDALRDHLAQHVGDDQEAFVFTGPSGRLLWRGNFNQLVGWRATVGKIGKPGLHFHDLRRTGNTLAAATGTSLRDLMARMGHDSPAAALIYQHATSRADQRIAKALGDAMAAGDDQVEGQDA
jgi:hypothetical protein